MSCSDYSNNSDTTTSGDTTANEEEYAKEIQTKIKRTIENIILNEWEKKKRTRLFTFEDRTKKRRKNLKMNKYGYKIKEKKLKIF
ncbi:conserved Plasmodium protein, unknown function [Plasmodium gaboni]|uniref:Uncharacterized protein n=1 Tax=Plasmodium gaboni TaxID=647221 RepID=A0ABY1UI66_9APIC|nr:conserved Plasmodium protein, unknown function [Plasmodium gaboni]